MIILSLSHMCMAVLLLGAQEIDSKMGEGWMGEENFAPLFSLSFQQYLLSHICFPCLLRIVTEEILLKRKRKEGAP